MRHAAERLDQFMARANAAYYATRDPFVDFTTAPEISQVFGETVGLWAAVTWQLMGAPKPVLLVEAGPGRGTLMADALRAISHAAPAFRDALSVHLIETAPRLRTAQSQRIPDAAWHDALATVPQRPLLFVANEFLDALPIRQFVRRGDRWTERYVCESRWLEQSSVGPPHPPAMMGEADIVEIRESADTLAAELGARLAANPGAAIFLDYGSGAGGHNDTLQAIRNGRPADPLAEPGSADLTAHVDFAAVIAAAKAAGATVHGPIPQGVFLTRLGLFQRTDRLARHQPPDRALALIAAARRLAEPSAMGRLFKALALCHAGCPTPPGFES
jgi:NADH dehydrogenase [ubiquinone] 1 alpha subcomplex assembly factor 7